VTGVLVQWARVSDREQNKKGDKEGNLLDDEGERSVSGR